MVAYEERVVLGRLKSETADQHAVLERKLDLLAPGLNTRRYSGLLQRFFGFYATWEDHALGAVPDRLRDFLVSRLKVPLLKGDLLALGFRPEQITELPRCATPPPLGSPEELLGSMYVLEGSTLGGQIISKHLLKIGISRDGAGIRFFQGYNGATASRWKEFGEVVQSFSSPIGDAVMIASAQRTFSALEGWLCPGEQ